MKKLPFCIQSMWLGLMMLVSGFVLAFLLGGPLARFFLLIALVGLVVFALSFLRAIWEILFN